MGEAFLNFWKTRISREQKLGFAAAFVSALLIHMYKLNNSLITLDSVYTQYSVQNMTKLGRWALAPAGAVSSYWDLHWLNGVLGFFYMALAVMFIIKLFEIKNPVVAVLTGALTASAPATTATLFYNFTFDIYMLAMLFASAAVYLSRLEEKRFVCHATSAVLLCLCCAMYQAYLSFALVLAICYFICVLLENNFDRNSCLRWVLRQVLVFGAAVAAYYIIWKLALKLGNVEVSNYQGAAEAGQLSLAIIPQWIKKSFLDVGMFFLQWNVLERSFSPYALLSLLFLAAFAAGGIIAVKKSGILKRKWALLLLAACLAALIPFACIWHLATPGVESHALMFQSLTLLFVLTALLYDRWVKCSLRDAVCLLLVVIVFNNAVMANVGYFYMNKSYERSYATGAEMMLRIHELQDENPVDRIAILGSKSSELAYEMINQTEEGEHSSGQLHLISRLLMSDLLYDAGHTSYFLQEFFGLELPLASQEERDALFMSEEVQAMGCWPAGDSTAVIDGALVIKLSNEWELGHGPDAQEDA